MSRFLLDQGIPQSTAKHLQEQRHDAVHVHTLGMSRASDRSIVGYARAGLRTVITLDADFHALLALGNESTPSVIRIRREGLQGEDIAKLLERAWPLIHIPGRSRCDGNDYG